MTKTVLLLSSGFVETLRILSVAASAEFADWDFAPLAGGGQCPNLVRISFSCVSKPPKTVRGKSWVKTLKKRTCHGVIWGKRQEF